MDEILAVEYHNIVLILIKNVLVYYVLLHWLNFPPEKVLICHTIIVGTLS